jgi:hypothetical protein
MAGTASWAPGWFRDPTGRHDHRWWDGAAWTGHVADAGTASHDPLPGPTEGSPAPQPPSGPSRLPSTAAGPQGRDPVAVAALAVGIGALPLAILPGFGLALPIAAIVLGVIGRSRIRMSGRAGDGHAIAGLVLGIVGLLVALAVSAFAVVLLSGSGGELAGAFAEYVACLEVRTEAECRILLEESLSRLIG